MKVIVTGSKGQLGSCLTKKLSGRVELLALDSGQLDITSSADVNRVVSNFQPDIIVNTAAYTSVDKAESEPDLVDLVNCTGPLNLATAAEKCGAVLVHMSTDYVFDGEGKFAFKESDLPSPKSVYGQSKLAGEVAVAEACSRHIILRTSWVFGEYGNNFVKTMLRLVSDRDTLRIVADQYGSPTYAGDISDAIISTIFHIDSGKTVDWGVYHFSGYPYVSWYEFAVYIFRQAELNRVLDKAPILMPINSNEYPTPAQRPVNSRLDCGKIQEKFGIQPSDWQHALTNIAAYK